jgi:hypothetical protein
MAQFDFFGSWNDSKNILNQIITFGDIKIIPNMAYRKPEVLQLQTISEIELEIIRKNHSVFLASDTFARFPIKFWGPDSRGDLSIHQLLSGPIMIMGLPDIYEEDGMLRMGAGDIRYPPHFINPITNQEYSPPEAMYSVFKSVKKMIQKSMVKLTWKYERSLANGEMRPDVQNFWIAKDAYIRMQKEPCYIKFGWRKITIADFFASQSDN